MNNEEHSSDILRKRDAKLPAGVKPPFVQSLTACRPAAALALAAYLCACGTSKDPVPDKQASQAPSAAPSSTPGAVSSAPTASAEPQGPPPIATLALQPFTLPDKTAPHAIFAVEGAVLVADRNRVGKLTGDTVEWVGEIPREIPPYGRNVITDLHGRFPDSIDVLYRADNGRAPRPTYTPLTGKGKPYGIGGGADIGFLTGVATSGESTVVIGWAPWTGAEIVAVRGPSLGLTPLLRELSSCKKDEIANNGRRPAVMPYAFGSTPAGTLMSAGTYCEDNQYGAEVWDPSTKKSRIVDLGKWVKGVDFFSKLLPAQEDELWFFAGEKSPILHYKGGQFEPLPAVDRPFRTAFLSWKKQLHASDGQTIYRYEAERWVPVARLTWPADPRLSFVMDEKDRFWASFAGVYQLAPGKSTELTDGCTTPLVHLYDVKPDNAKDFTFPTTRKALSTFAGAEELSLVDFQVDGARRLGVPVSSKAQGEALIAHVKANMKDEDPRLVCYEPREPRKIQIKAKGK